MTHHKAGFDKDEKLKSSLYNTSHAKSIGSDRKVHCVDGTIYTLDSYDITDEVACAYHGGVLTMETIS